MHVYIKLYSSERKNRFQGLTNLWTTGKQPLPYWACRELFFFPVAKWSRSGKRFKRQVSYYYNVHPTITIQHHFLDEKEDEKTELHSVKHSSRPEHIDSHIDFFKNKEKKNIESCRTLWEKRNEFLPYLILCSQVEKALKKGFELF